LADDFLMILTSFTAIGLTALLYLLHWNPQHWRFGHFTIFTHGVRAIYQHPSCTFGPETLSAAPSLFAFYTQCRGAHGPAFFFYHFAKGLAGYPFAFNNRCCSTSPLPRKL
jgi:hypothetical protein